MSEKVLCETCGNEMEYYQERHTCGWICPVCGDGMVTTYLEPIERDQIVYTVFVDVQVPEIDTIKASAKVFDCNYLEAKRGLTEGSLSTTGTARDIQKKALRLQEGKVTFHIEPEFPYPIKKQ